MTQKLGWCCGTAVVLGEFTKITFWTPMANLLVISMSPRWGFRELNLARCLLFRKLWVNLTYLVFSWQTPQRKNSIRHTKEAELAVPVLVMVKLLAIERYMYLCSSVLYHEEDYPIYLYIYIYLFISYPTWCCDANDIVMNTVIIIRYTVEPHMYSKLCKSW